MIDLSPLPRGTVYQPREVSSANILRAATGSNLQAVGRKGDHWALDVSIPTVSAAKCGPDLVAELTRGKLEPVVMAWPDKAPAQSWGAPTVRASSAGTALLLKGLTPGLLIPRKFLSIISAGQRYLYQVAGEETVDGSGNVDLTLTQPLRYPPATNDVVELATPKIEGLITPGIGWSQSFFAAYGDLKFTLEERA